MQEQRTLLGSQVAFIFVLLLASTNGTADSPSKKVKDYDVEISELGEKYKETIEVDTEKQTELFKVPAHNNVDQSNIFHDFKTSMSMLLLPDRRICYLLPLNDGLLEPRKLISDLDTAEGKTSKVNKTTINDNRWISGSEVTDRSELSDELADFCPAEYPIYRVTKEEDSTKVQADGRTNRNRRGFMVCRWSCCRTCYTYLECNSFCCYRRHVINYVCRFYCPYNPWHHVMLR